MTKRDITITYHTAVWEKMVEKMRLFFSTKLKKTDLFQMVILINLYFLNKDLENLKSKIINKTDTKVAKAKELRDSLLQPSNVNVLTKNVTIAVDTALLKKLKDEWTKLLKKGENIERNDLIDFAIAIIATADLSELLAPLQALYSFTGYKNPEMQNATAMAVSAMNLQTHELTLVEICCGSAALTLGLNQYKWKQIILNDLDPLKSNFLNGLIAEPLKLVQAILNTGIKYDKSNMNDQAKIDAMATEINAFAKKRAKYHQVSCNLKIAAYFFLCACTKNNFRSHWLSAETIWQRLLCFLPAALKLRYSNAIVTQQDALDFLDNNGNITLPHGKSLHLDADRFLLSDTPYPGSERYSGKKGYNYKKFHKTVANKLTNSNYPFLYFCRSTAPKGDHRPIDIKHHEMALLLAQLFFNKGLYCDKVHLTWGCKEKEDGSTTESATELMISNRRYSNTQFIWNADDQDLA